MITCDQTAATHTHTQHTHTHNTHTHTPTTKKGRERFLPHVDTACMIHTIFFFYPNHIKHKNKKWILKGVCKHFFGEPGCSHYEQMNDNTWVPARASARTLSLSLAREIFTLLSLSFTGVKWFCNSLSLLKIQICVSYFAEFVCCEVLASNSLFVFLKMYFSLPQLFVFLFDILSAAVFVLSGTDL